MRNRYAVGIPLAASAATGGAAALQGGDPLEVIGAGAAGALGASAGLRLAGKFAPGARERVVQANQNIQNAGAAYKAKQGMTGGADGSTRGYTDAERRVDDRMRDFQNVTDNIYTEQNIRRGAAAGLVPVTAGAAALGGIAAGKALGAVGQALGIDPEAPGSSNTIGSRINMQSPMYTA
tara:strand:- start:518 stop:1054 length:537 start_codon:yes stop_codon:yes gene_type:complete